MNCDLTCSISLSFFFITPSFRCIVAYTFSHPKYSFALAANRDEYLNRPTKAANWHHNDSVLSGIDITGGGTWLGISKRGRVGVLTNFTEPPPAPSSSPLPTRGCLAMDWLCGSEGDNDSLDNYVHRIESHKSEYAGFNLLLAQLHPPQSAQNTIQPQNTKQHYIVSNRSTPPLPPDDENGVISNGRFGDEAAWPKVGQLQQSCPILMDFSFSSVNTTLFDEIWSSLG